MIILFVALALVLSGGMAFFAFSSTSNLNKTFYSLDYSLPNLWVTLDAPGYKDRPMYDTLIVEDTTIRHFRNNLLAHFNSFKLGFFYFDSKSLEEMKGQYVTGVRISLSASIPFSKDYYKATTYIIEQKEYLWF